jgi:hypothetical protein
VRAVALAGALAALASGCEMPAATPHPRLWTMFDLARLAPAASAGADGPRLAADDGLPGGVQVSHLVTTDSAGLALTLGDSWTESYRSAYVTTELWSGFSQVWVQPVYVAASAFNADGAAVRAAGAKEIFSVGPGSAFYSPYWQIVFFELPDGAAAETFTSARQVIESGAVLHPAGATVLSLIPPGGIGQPTDATATAPFRKIGKIPVATGWLDGQPVDFLKLGTGTFSWNADRVVQELPLFVLTARDDNGDIKPLDGIPTIGGSGPIGSGIGPDISQPSGQPRYGALWRVYTVLVPAAARVFAPREFPNPAVLQATTYMDEVFNAPVADVEAYAGRVALNPGCFDTLDHIQTPSAMGACVWLDAQRIIEREIDPFWIRRTDVLLTCPFVSYNDAAVPPPPMPPAMP